MENNNNQVNNNKVSVIDERATLLVKGHAFKDAYFSNGNQTEYAALNIAVKAGGQKNEQGGLEQKTEDWQVEAFGYRAKALAKVKKGDYVVCEVKVSRDRAQQTGTDPNGKPIYGEAKVHLQVVSIPAIGLFPDPDQASAGQQAPVGQWGAPQGATAQQWTPQAAPAQVTPQGVPQGTPQTWTPQAAPAQAQPAQQQAPAQSGYNMTAVPSAQEYNPQGIPAQAQPAQTQPAQTQPAQTQPAQTQPAQTWTPQAAPNFQANFANGSELPFS